MARPADPVAAQTACHQTGRFEGSELLQHARPARADALGDQIRRCRPAGPERVQHFTPQCGRGPGPRRRRDQRCRRPDSALDHLGVRAVFEGVRVTVSVAERRRGDALVQRWRGLRGRRRAGSSERRPLCGRWRRRTHDRIAVHGEKSSSASQNLLAQSASRRPALLAEAWTRSSASVTVGSRQIPTGKPARESCASQGAAVSKPGRQGAKVACNSSLSRASLRPAESG